MAKCRVRATITVPIEVEIDIDDHNIDWHGSTVRAIEAATEEMANAHVVFCATFNRGKVESVEHVRVDDWDFE